jgi:uncharacterized protein (DUF433 family)
MDWKSRIVRDPRIASGRPVFRGTRVLLSTVLANLAEGASVAQILTDFPSLCEVDVRPATAFAAASAEEDLRLLLPPTLAP